MGKIVKYCSSCEEGFAERFTFCPDCGSQLQSYEMKPVAAGDSKADAEEPQKKVAAEQFAEASNVSAIEALPSEEATPNVDAEMEEMFSAEPAQSADVLEEPIDTPVIVNDAETVHEDEVSFAAIEDAAASSFDSPSDRKEEEALFEAVEDEVSEEIEEYGETDDAGKTEPLPVFTGGYFYQSEAAYADEPRDSKPTAPTSYSRPDYDDGGFYVTVIQEKNSKQRNVLLMGSAAFMLTLTLIATVYSLFNKSLGVSAIDEGTLFSAVIVDEVPMTVEEEKQQKDKDQGGGGGGGGRDEKDPTSKGQLASQTQKPLINPTKTIVQKNFELTQPIAATEGNRQMPRTDQPYGDPNSKFGGLSDGTGTGGGQGSGFGQGQGSGTGTGMGSGSGSGSGSGIGDGNGSGRGSGKGPPERSSVTSPLKILYRPRAQYNEEGRKNNVQGSVRLRVELRASGQVGSITPVTRLPYGLTEQAIAAARQIRFEPKKVNGIPITTIQVIEYSFTIY